MGLALVLLIKVRVSPCLKAAHGVAAQGQGCPAVDGDSVGNHHVGLGSVPLRLEGISVGGIGVEGERALDGQRGLRVLPTDGARKAPVPLPVPTVVAPAIIPLPPSVPAFTFTAPMPVPEPKVLLTLKAPALTVVVPV